jgi:transcriptional regulator with XRE-family HTH domain
MDQGLKPQGALNPFVAIRRQMQLGQAEFARVIGCSLPALWAAERGTTAKPTIILRGLQELGYEATQLAEKYGEWRSAMLKDERFRLRIALESEGKDKPDDKQSQ